MKKTLNNLIAILKYFADQHLMINSFSFGNLEEIANLNETAVKYPLLHCQVDSSSIDKNWIYFNFNCLMMDIVAKDESNQSEVLSDSAVVLADLYNYLSMSQAFKSEFILVDQTGQLIPFSERFQDEVSGFNLKIQIKVRNSGTCNIPFISIVE